MSDETRDPASLTASINLDYMSSREAGVLLTILPTGSRVAFTVSQPGLGGKRYLATASNLSMLDAAFVLSTLADDLTRMHTHATDPTP